MRHWLMLAQIWLNRWAAANHKQLLLVLACISATVMVFLFGALYGVKYVDVAACVSKKTEKLEAKLSTCESAYLKCEAHCD